jgi:FkbH-like protein
MTDLATANVGATAGWLVRTSWQSAIFAAQLNRADLIQLKPGWACDPLRVNVHRNQPFEFIGSVLPKFLAYSGWSAVLHYGPYDDSLGFSEVPPADAEIVWLDFHRYGEARRRPSWFAWLKERLARLRAVTSGPVLLLDAASPGRDSDRFNRELRKVALALPGIHVCSQSMIAAGLTGDYIDRRLASISGAQLSDRACLETARWLGLAWLPAALGVRIKCVVVDLDWTLYEGAIAEDGADGIRISEAHQGLIQALLQLRQQGLLLAILTRNDPADVEALFERNPEMPLKRSDLDAVMASWESKAKGLEAIAAALSIGTDALLMIDDNAGEIAEAAASAPEARFLHAADPVSAVRALKLYPGLHRFEATATDALRAADVAATTARRKLAGEANDVPDYLRSLQIRLSLQMDSRALVGRLHELSLKTNQFNTSLQRLSEVEVAAYVDDPERRVVAVALADRLSDSGVVAALFARREDDTLVIDEIAISCRALGRHVEGVIIAEAIRGVLRELPARRLACRYTEGPRNAPARIWLAEVFGSLPLDSERAVRDLHDDWLAGLVDHASVAISWVVDALR